MDSDCSEGWDGIAEHFMTARSEVGVTIIRSWARDRLPTNAAVLDIGCGSGLPVARALVENGFTVFGVDASPRMIDAFRRHLPASESACEAAQDSPFFHRTFDAAVAIGLLFLLCADDQRRLIPRVADALRPNGRFLYTAPREACAWRDVLTGRMSVSLGAQEYGRILAASGLRLVGRYVDEGGNIHHDAVKPVLAP
ncbi:class I SAM-dependent methyltransferase [Allosphingosinicella deserti]|uniref:SAM-dependent methyltransferase n=1 Tax=Allosphingosinicella deserti TaxID=2116704 RepID=A0A2P7QHI6_9SPHN|nr:class I SAM-dependent methyltransferase [Sphingomonas deserti]PSJ37413.1 SAM-dependent methyltransferase [Sphingomonas deserti]